MGYLPDGLSVHEPSTIADPFFLVGATLDGQFRLDAVVGEGGFGVVYRGFHLALEQPIAVKVLKVPDEAPEFREMLLGKFREEAKLLYTLSQESLDIVRAMSFGGVMTPAGVWAPYMVLEWLDGRSLDDDLEDRRRRGLRGRSVDEALALLAPVASGLSIAHRRRVVHRDIKPGNVFLLPSTPGGGLRAKVLDFGIAKVLREDGTAGTRSRFASFTWLYGAPEQLDPRLGSIGLWTDVHAFALLLTEMLTDRAPIDARDTVALYKIVTDPAVRPTPRQRGANVPDAIENVCRRALDVDPHARFPSIDELWIALEMARRQSASAGTVMTPSVRASHPVPTPMPMPVPAAHSVSGMPVAPPHTGRPGPPPPLQTAFPVPPQTGHPGPPGVPPPMWRPPYVMRPTKTSSAPMIIAIVLIVVLMLFTFTCSMMYAACS